MHTCERTLSFPPSPLFTKIQISLHLSLSLSHLCLDGDDSCSYSVRGRLSGTCHSDVHLTMRLFQPISNHYFRVGDISFIFSGIQFSETQKVHVESICRQILYLYYILVRLALWHSFIVKMGIKPSFTFKCSWYKSASDSPRIFLTSLFFCCSGLISKYWRKRWHKIRNIIEYAAK